MAQLKNYREVGIFDLLSAPLNPIGAFDAEQFKKDVRGLLDERKDDKFVAVDLTGLDFLYSDAYNALLQFQRELSSRGGMIAVLTNNTIIVDGFKKAGIDKKLKVFSFEAEMMAFSLHNQTPAQEASVIVVDQTEPQEAKVSSQNNRESTESERHTGAHRKFTKSFNAIAKDGEKLAKKGLNMPFEEEKSSGKTVLFIILGVVLLGGLAAYLLLA